MRARAEETAWLEKGGRGGRKKYLYVAALVRDDEKRAHPDKDARYGCDSLAVILSPPGWLTSGARSQGPTPLQVSYGLSYYSPGTSPRPLGPDCRYAVNDTADDNKAKERA